MDDDARESACYFVYVNAVYMGVCMCKCFFLHLFIFPRAGENLKISLWMSCILFCGKSSHRSDFPFHNKMVVRRLTCPEHWVATSSIFCSSKLSLTISGDYSWRRSTCKIFQSTANDGQGRNKFSSSSYISLKVGQKPSSSSLNRYWQALKQPSPVSSRWLSNSSCILVDNSATLGMRRWVDQSFVDVCYNRCHRISSLFSHPGKWFENDYP